MNHLILILVGMLFCHIIDDYVLQAPCLCNLKQKSWWEKNAPDQKYRHDYVVGLIVHSVSWGISITLPIIIALKGELNWLWILLPINIIIHAIVDHLKANKRVINLVHDQTIHLVQIVITWLFYACYI
jgi:hypothetical protein